LPDCRDQAILAAFMKAYRPPVSLPEQKGTN
jgi:hypothetical protein